MRLVETIELESLGEVTVLLNVNHTFIKGNYSGLPEDCYPDEEELEINVVGIKDVFGEVREAKYYAEVNEELDLLGDEYFIERLGRE